MSLMVALQPSLGRAVVVGGGRVATRKVHALAEAGFAVTVVAPFVASEIRGLVAVLVVERPFTASDIDGAALVFACTNDRAVNRGIGELARARGVPVLVADARAESTFFSVATLRVADLLVGVSTGGSGPGRAMRVRDRIAFALASGAFEEPDQ